MGVGDKLKSLDLFGDMFQFQMGVGKKTRNTYFGALLSILMLFTAIAYFVFLNYQFFNGNLTPKITSQDKKIAKITTMQMTPGLLSFDVFSLEDAMSLKKREVDTGKHYLTYTVYIGQWDSKNQKSITTDIPTDFCEKLISEDDIGDINPDAQCLDLSDLSEEQKAFVYYPEAGMDTYLVIKANQCVPANDPLCATDLDDQLYGDDVGFSMYFELQQFDTDSAEINYKLIENSWDFDQTLSTSSSVYLLTTQNTLKDGFLIPYTEENTFFSEIQSSDSFKYKDSPKADETLVAQFVIRMSGRQSVEMIQYAQYPEILAQFGSILNVLLLIGIIGKIVSRSDIQQYLIDQRLKEYYKRNAFQILSEKKNQNNKNNAKQDEKTKELPQNAKDILQATENLEGKNMNDELASKFKISGMGKIAKLLKSEDKEALMKKKRSDKDLYDVLYFDALKSQDIFTLQSELLRMKKILNILITPQQYAAIKCCGSSISDQIPYLLDNDKENKAKSAKVSSAQLQENATVEKYNLIEVQKELNHIEAIDKIDYDEEYFMNNLQSFLKDSDTGFSQESQHSQVLSQRLYKTLQKTYNLDEKPIVLQSIS